MALSIAGKKTGFPRRQLLAFAERIGLPAATGARVLDETLDAIEQVIPEWQDGTGPFSAQITADVIRNLKSRRSKAIT